MATYSDPARPNVQPAVPLRTALKVLPDRASQDVAPQRQAIADELARCIRGQVRFGDHDRMLYATDASPYQVDPIGVVIPLDIEDMQCVLRFCREHTLPLLPRGGGTSLAGQCTNQAIVLDLSALCRRVLAIDPQEKICHVEAGIGIDELNRQIEQLAPGLLYAPDPATVAQATVGGTIGNNAAGGRSIRYGRTSENIAGVEVLLPGGQRCWLEPGAGRRDETSLRLARGVAEVCRRHAELIQKRFPKTIRRNAGYGLDLIQQQIDQGIADEDLDLSGLICGSEGTLAVVATAKLKLHPAPQFTALAIASFPSLDDAMDAVSPILATKPSAVELLDDVVLRAAKGNEVCRAYVDLLPRTTVGNEPVAVLYAEYQAVERVDVEQGLNDLKTALPNVSIEIYRDKPAMLKAWTLRKSGEALLHGLPGKRKPQTFVEDNAVPVERLPEFVRRFRDVVSRHGTVASYWAHASVGVLHVRPMLDLHDPADLERMRAIAVEIADLARDCGGVMSGEHGDGRVRGPLLERFFGSELVRAFAEIKQLFDPTGILNPGMIIGAGPVETITDHLRATAAPTARQDNAIPHASIETYYDYSDQDGFDHAVEQCNGAGFCRKTAGGTMCPSYRGTMDERHSTRGRGNALRLAITGQLPALNGKPNFGDAETIKTLDLCLSCKACKTECPSNVDIARLKAEYTAQHYKEQGVPLYARLFGNIRTLNRLGAISPGLANAVNRLPPVRALMNRLLGLAPQRSLPAYAASLYRQARLRKRPGAPRVVLYADCFATYNEPHIGVAAIRVLESFGYEVVLPVVGCCGRAMMSLGMLEQAIGTADATLRQLRPHIEDPSVAAILVLEPSCLASFKDDWLSLKLSHPLSLRKQLAEKAFLVEDFIERRWDQHPTQQTFFSEPTQRLILHGHCHQKALWGDQTSSALLRRIAGDRLDVLPSGCCGMAGSFGYLTHRYDLSMAIGELNVFPPIRQSTPQTEILAPGTSCRHQIRDGTGRTALHPVEWLDRMRSWPAPKNDANDYVTCSPLISTAAGRRGEAPEDGYAA